MKKYFCFVITIIAMVLGLFFIYKGFNKHFLSPCKVFEPDSTILLEYQQVVTHMCQSGMLKVVGFFQVLSGLFLLIPRTRLMGAIILLPIIFNIFILHLFLDNRPHELVETGIPLAVTIIIIVYNFPNWKTLITKR